MARTKNNNSKESVLKKPSNASLFAKALSKETGSESFLKSKYTQNEKYIDTGSYALNRIMSGSIYGGIPEGALTLLSGESATGKSLFTCAIAANAVNKNGYDSIIYVDTEGGINANMLINNGVNPEIVQYVPVSCVEECTVKMIQIFKTIEKFQTESDPNFKALIILDSIGGLVSQKTLLDADKDKQTQDMGQLSRLTGACLKAITMPAKKTGCPVLLISQIYADPNSMFASKIQNIRGGKSLLYQPSLIVQLSRKLEKGTEKEDNFYEDSLIRAFTIKTRNNVRPFLETEIKLSFKNGFSGNEYWGLVPDAIRLGFIKNPKQGWYTVPSAGDGSYRLGDLIGGEKAKALWDTFIDKFEEVSRKECSYKPLFSTSISDIEKQLKEDCKAVFKTDFADEETKDE